jgi:hypothetical protein
VAIRGSSFRCAQALVVLLCGAFSPTASARTLAEVPYSRAQTFSAALRYLRVDLGYEVTEKDPDAAYLLFAYGTGKSEGARGAIEVVQREHGVRVFVSLPKLPSYHEEVLKQGLMRKLVDEYGEPVKEKDKHSAPDRNKPEKPEPDESSKDKDRDKDKDKDKDDKEGASAPSESS